MENGIKVKIPLNAVLDSNTADMLCDINNPKLIFNRQVWQGNYLPSSLRYEANGWFCGNYGYDYTKDTAAYLTDTASLLSGSTWGINVQKRWAYLTYVYRCESINENDEILARFDYYPTTVVVKQEKNDITINYKLSEDNKPFVTLTGKTSDQDIPYEVTFDLTGTMTNGSAPIQSSQSANLLTKDEERLSLTNEVSFNGQRFVFKYRVYDKNTTFSDNIHIYLPQDLYIGDDVYEMSLTDGEIKFGDYLKGSIQGDMFVYSTDEAENLSAQITEESKVTLQYTIPLTCIDSLNMSYSTIYIEYKILQTDPSQASISVPDMSSSGDAYINIDLGKLTISRDNVERQFTNTESSLQLIGRLDSCFGVSIKNGSAGKCFYLGSQCLDADENIDENGRYADGFKNTIRLIGVFVNDDTASIPYLVLYYNKQVSYVPADFDDTTNYKYSHRFVKYLQNLIYQRVQNYELKHDSELTHTGYFDVNSSSVVQKLMNVDGGSCQTDNDDNAILYRTTDYKGDELWLGYYRYSTANSSGYHFAIIAGKHPSAMYTVGWVGDIIGEDVKCNLTAIPNNAFNSDGQTCIFVYRKNVEAKAGWFYIKYDETNKRYNAYTKSGTKYKGNIDWDANIEVGTIYNIGRYSFNAQINTTGGTLKCAFLFSPSSDGEIYFDAITQYDTKYGDINTDFGKILYEPYSLEQMYRKDFDYPVIYQVGSTLKVRDEDYHHIKEIGTFSTTNIDKYNDIYDEQLNSSFGNIIANNKVYVYSQTSNTFVTTNGPDLSIHINDNTYKNVPGTLRPVTYDDATKSGIAVSIFRPYTGSTFAYTISGNTVTFALIRSANKQYMFTPCLHLFKERHINDSAFLYVANDAPYTPTSYQDDFMGSIFCKRSTYYTSISHDDFIYFTYPSVYNENYIVYNQQYDIRSLTLGAHLKASNSVYKFPTYKYNGNNVNIALGANSIDTVWDGNNVPDKYKFSRLEEYAYLIPFYIKCDDIMSVDMKNYAESAPLSISFVARTSGYKQYFYFAKDQNGSYQEPAYSGNTCSIAVAFYNKDSAYNNILAQMIQLKTKNDTKDLKDIDFEKSSIVFPDFLLSTGTTSTADITTAAFNIQIALAKAKSVNNISVSSSCNYYHNLQCIKPIKAQDATFTSPNATSDKSQTITVLHANPALNYTLSYKPGLKSTDNEYTIALITNNISSTNYDYRVVKKDCIGNYGNLPEWPYTTTAESTNFSLSGQYSKGSEPSKIADVYNDKNGDADKTNINYEITKSGSYSVSATLQLPSVKSEKSSEIEYINGYMIGLMYNGHKEELELDFEHESIKSDAYNASLSLIADNIAYVYLEGMDFDEGTFTLESFYNKGTDKGIPIAIYKSTDEYGDITFLYNDKESTVGKYEIIDSKTWLDITAKNITEGTEKRIASIDMNEDYTIIKQFWDTTNKTEKYYWLTSNYVMQITADKIIVYSKIKDTTTTDELSVHDWNGNKWKIEVAHEKTDFIDSDILKYGVSCVYGESNEAVFWTMEVLDDASFRITFYTEMYEKDFRKYTNIIRIGQKKNLGQKLVTNSSAAKLESYQKLTAYEIVANSDVSCTRLEDCVLLGIALDKNLKQWTLQFSNSYSFKKVITGYGIVGPDGSITGNEIPAIAFDVNQGFSGTVYSLNDLSNDQEDLSTAIDGEFKIQGIYGNELQQWYIYKEVKNIVSHIGYNVDSHSFYAVTLPIINKYSADYTSTSFYINNIMGLNASVTSLFGLLPFNNRSVKRVLETITRHFSPTIWFLDPCWTKFGYLQQSIGQYAYVYHNSTNDMVGRDNVENEDYSSTKERNLQFEGSSSLLEAFKNEHKQLTKDDLSFDRQAREQILETDTAKAKSIGFFYSLLMSGLGGAATILGQTKVNETINQTTGNDIAKQFSQFALDNALASASSDIGAYASSTLSMASKVVAVKTLDMFYSTSANSKMYAGPGYVCHRYIGTCIAQSVSNRFIQANQTGMFTILTPLSIIDLKLKNIPMQIAQSIATKIAEGYMSGSSSQFMLAGLASGGSINGIANMVIGITALTASSVAGIFVDINNFMIELLPQIARVLTMADGATNTNYGNIASHNIDIEAKHQYGSKHLDLMWPCFNTPATEMTVEWAEAAKKTTKAAVDFSDKSSSVAEYFDSSSLYDTHMLDENINLVKKSPKATSLVNNNFKKTLKGDLYSEYIYCQGKSKKITNMPDDMAVVEGCTAFLSPEPFKNENINVQDVFTVAPVQDYMLSEIWQLGVTANESGVSWVSCKDTKLIDGSYSNVIITPNECLVASSYTAIEIHKQIEEQYIRPYAVTPTALAWNFTGLNVCTEENMYHGFDGIGYRITEWHGSSGMDKESLVWFYCLQSNGRFKRGNILPPGQFLGNFNSLASHAAYSRDPIYCTYRIDNKNINTYNTIANENRDQTRYSIPIFVDVISTLPTIIKTLTSYKLLVYEGVTSITTIARITQGDYKVPDSVDFAIGNKVFRSTSEYICLLNEKGLPVGELVATLGLQFIGATPTQAFFYSDATRAYYVFTGNNNITKVDVWNRFKNIKDGKWDFVNQEVVFQCLGNMTRLYDNTNDYDDSSEDNLCIAHLSGEGITGDITPPNRTIFNDDSWFKTYSFTGGLGFQGPNRFIVNRFICLDYMIEDILKNRNRWTRVSRDEFYPFRKYPEEFRNVSDRIGDRDDSNFTLAKRYNEGEKYYIKAESGKYEIQTVTKDTFEKNKYYIKNVLEGWTHNPFLLCTSPLGVNVETDCIFEWEITFTWLDEMDKLYDKDSYACVNIMAQTMCPGGKKRSDVTHLYLTKDLFTRSDNTGYYSFRFSSRNGAGNREQLFIWSDAYIAMSGLAVEYKVITQRRQTPLSTSQVNIQEMSEF